MKAKDLHAQIPHELYLEEFGKQIKFKRWNGYYENTRGKNVFFQTSMN